MFTLHVWWLFTNSIESRPAMYVFINSSPASKTPSSNFLSSPISKDGEITTNSESPTSFTLPAALPLIYRWPCRNQGGACESKGGRRGRGTKGVVVLHYLCNTNQTIVCSNISTGVFHANPPNIVHESSTSSKIPSQPTGTRPRLAMAGPTVGFPTQHHDHDNVQNLQRLEALVV